jgi:hypothetical protein
MNKPLLKIVKAYRYKSTSYETAFYFQFVVISADMSRKKVETSKVTLFKRPTDLRTSSNCDRQGNQKNACLKFIKPLFLEGF